MIYLKTSKEGKQSKCYFYVLENLRNMDFVLVFVL